MVARIVAVMFLANAAFNAFGQEAVRVAKVDFREIEPLLLEAAFAKPENAELKKSYEATQQKQKEMMGRMLDAQKSGAFNPMEFARDFASKPWDTEKAARNLARGELIAVIEEIYGDKYQLVISESLGEGILYTKLTIPDITPNVRQHMLKAKASKEKPKP